MKKQKRHSFQKRRATIYAVIAVAMALLAAVTVRFYLARSGAATFALTAEAEAGVLAGAAAKDSQAAGASGGEAVRFASGAAPQGECIVPANQKLQDQDTSDSPETPWKRTGPEVVIYFEYGKAIAEHQEYVKKAAEYWGRSACLDTRAVATCPSGQNCITTRSVSGSNGDTDGEFTGTQSGGWRVGGRVDLFTDVLNEEKPNGRLVTTVHEFGHGVGLIHRKADVMMNATTDDTMNPEPDDIDYQNLLVIYGTKI